MFLFLNHSYSEPITLSSSNYNETVLAFKLPKYSFSSVDNSGEIYTGINSENAAQLMEKGLPALPYYTASISIPGNANMALEIVEVEYEEINLKHKIISSKGNLSRSVNKDEIAYTFGDIYGENKYFPEEDAFLREPYVLHGIRGQVIQFQPFRYNSNTNILKVSKSIKVKIFEDGLSDANRTESSVKIKSAYKSVLDKHFINSESINFRYDMVPDGDRMVVVSHSDFKSEVAPLVEWKNRTGIKTDLYIYPDETGGEGAATLHEFLKNQYNNEKMTYVLLVGDHEFVPSTILTIKSKPYASDPTYTKLDGDDCYPDVFIGRLSVETAEQAALVVNKTLNYEMNPDPSADWYNKSIGIASSESGLGDTTDIIWMRGFNNELIDYNYNYIDSIYQGDGQVVNDLRDFINDGRGLINFMGHGLSTGFGFRQGFWFADYNVRKLVNGDKLPVIIATACYNGRFHNRTCFAEEWQRLDGGGSLLYLGASPELDWTPPQTAHKEMINLITNDVNLSMGSVIYNSEIKMLEEVGEKSEKTFNTWNLFGDPSITLFTNKPEEINFEITNTITTGVQSLTVNLSKPIDGRVGIYGNKYGYLSSDIIDNNNIKTLSISIPDDETSIAVTVTGRNVVPLSKDFEVGPTKLFKNIKTTASDLVQIRNGSSKISFKIKKPGAYKVTLWNLSGQKIKSFETSNAELWQTINVPAKGMHFITVNSGDKCFMQKYINLN